MSGSDLANTTIHDVQRELAKDGDSKSAATILMSELDKERADTTLKPGDFDKYVQDVMAGLKQELPSLSVGWVANNINDSRFTKIDNNPSDDSYGQKVINLDMLSGISVANKMSAEGQLANAFMQQASTIDGRNTYKSTDGQVSVDELNQFMSDTKDQVSNLAYAKMFSTAAGKILLDQLDTRGKGIFSGLVRDGNFDVNNLNQFITDYKNNGDNVGTVQSLSDETGMTKQQVIDALQKMADHWNDPQFKLMEDGGIMNAASIAKGAGFTSLEACAQAGVCNVNEAIVPPTVASDPINTIDTSRKPLTTDFATLEPNANGQTLRIDYKTGLPTAITRGLDGKPINYVTGDGYTLAFDAVKNKWTENHYNANTKTTDSFDITAPTFNDATGQIDYTYTGPNAAKVQYRPDGVRVKTDAAGATQIQAPADGNTTTNPVNGTYDTHTESFGEAATSLAMAENSIASGGHPTQKQIQNAKIDILLAGYKQNVLKNVAPDANDPFIAKLQSMRPGANDPDNGSYGINEYITAANGKKISIYSILLGKINY